MLDLSQDLTVFLITVGNNPSYPLCVDALKRQTVRFRQEEIRYYRPLSRAYQEMLNRCRTRHFVQVDEDMVLMPEALERMHHRIVASPRDVCILTFPLRDVHLDRLIYGVKIYRHAIVHRYPYDLTHSSCEVEQLERLRADGFRHQAITDPAGEHAPLWSGPLIFERYLNLMEKHKAYGYSWLANVPSRLWELLRATPTLENLYAFLGAYTSIISRRPLLDGERDFTVLRHEYQAIRAFLEPSSLDVQRRSGR